MNRPSSFDQFIGQEQIITNLKTYIDSSLLLNKKLDHILIYGNSGMGKTSLTYLIASVMKVKMHFLNGPSLQKPSDILSVLTNLKDFDIVFIDEIHAVSKEVMEMLYPALEDSKINVIVGKEYNAHNINIDLPPFVLIGATTELDKIPIPFYNRFPIFLSLENYTIEQLGLIIRNYANSLDLNINEQISVVIAKHCRNTPRIGKNIIKRINDFFLTNQIKDLNSEQEIINTLEKIGIQKDGLTKNDVEYLMCFKNHEIIGLDNLSQILNFPSKMVTTIIEPLLINKGYIIRTNKGRKITIKGKSQIMKLGK